MNQKDMLITPEIVMKFRTDLAKIRSRLDEQNRLFRSLEKRLEAVRLSKIHQS